jgi:hypothetical protein
MRNSRRLLGGQCKSSPQVRADGTYVRASAGKNPTFSAQEFFMHVADALFIATWMLYVADRLLDVHRASHLSATGHASSYLRDRHWFHARHAPAFLSCFAAAACILFLIVWRDRTAGMLRYEVLLGLLVAVYFAAIHLRGNLFASNRKLPWKEAAVGGIFSIAVAIPALTRARSPAHLLFAVVAFAILCATNCLVIETVERRLEQRIFFCESALLALTIATAAVSFIPRLSEDRLLLACVAASALLLLALCRMRDRLLPLTFRITADTAMLTPLLLILWPRR